VVRSMHEFTDETAALSDAIQVLTRQRIEHDQSLDRASSPDALTERVGLTITPEGIGGEEALRIWAEVLAPSTLSLDHPAFLAFVPGAPTKARTLPLFTAIAKSPVTARFYAVGRAASACFGEQRHRRGNAFGQLGRTPCARPIAVGPEPRSCRIRAAASTGLGAQRSFLLSDPELFRLIKTCRPPVVILLP